MFLIFFVCERKPYSSRAAALFPFSAGTGLELTQAVKDETTATLPIPTFSRSNKPTEYLIITSTIKKSPSIINYYCVIDTQRERFGN